VSVKERAPVTLPPRVVIATRSAGKRDEWRALFESVGIGVESLDDVGLPEDPAEGSLEVHATFEENARAKARWFAARLRAHAAERAAERTAARTAARSAHHAVIADDSGLMVDALGGAPGVRSKRWAGSARTGAALDADNNAALLRALARYEAPSERGARYVCAVVCVQAHLEWVARGECEGRILAAPQGSAGFGYDPYFWSVDLGCSFGDASREAKASVSHRGRAMRALLAQWSPREA